MQANHTAKNHYCYIHNCIYNYRTFLQTGPHEHVACLQVDIFFSCDSILQTSLLRNVQRDFTLERLVLVWTYFCAVERNIRFYGGFESMSLEVWINK